MNKPKLFLGGAIALGLSVSTTYALVAQQSRNSQKIPPLFFPQGTVNNNITYKWQVPKRVVNRLPKTVPIYRFVVVNNTEKDFQKLANRLGMKGKIEKSGNSLQPRFTIRENKKNLLLETNTGMWSYGNQTSPSIPVTKDRAIADIEVGKIATNYLRKNGWLPDDFRFKSVGVRTESGNSPSSVKVLQKTAYFYRQIRGNSVYCVSRILVDVGNQGQILGVDNYYKNIVPAGTVRLQNVRTAFNLLRNNKGTITLGESEIKTAQVKDVKIIYWEDAGSIKEQPFLQPVYVFEAEAKTKEGIKKFEGIVSALNQDTTLP
jgi:hypothetical protein